MCFFNVKTMLLYTVVISIRFYTWAWSLKPCVLQKKTMARPIHMLVNHGKFMEICFFLVTLFAGKAEIITFACYSYLYL